MNKPPDRKKRYSFLPFLVVLAVLFLRLTSQAAYAGDLVLSGNDVMVIENTTHIQTGNIYINDNAKLTIRNATLVLNINYHEEFMVYAQGSGTLEVINSTVKTSLGNEIVVINFWGSSNLIFSDSNLSEGLVYLQYSGNFQGNASVSNSKLQSISFTLTPSGAGSISVSNSSCNSMTLRFEGNYEGEFSDLKPGLLNSWSYTGNGYNIVFQNTTVNNFVVACDGPAQIVVRNSVIHQFAPNSPQSLISMTAIDSTLIQVPLHSLHDITASFWGLQRGLHADWTLSDHSSGDFLPNVILKNTTIIEGWNISSFQNSNLSIDDSTFASLRFYGNNANVYMTNSTANELMLYGAVGSTLNADNTIINLLNVYVPPNSFSIMGNVTFPKTAVITNWFAPSVIEREYPAYVKSTGGSGVPGVNLNLYRKDRTLVWSGTTDMEGKVNFPIGFDDGNYLDSWKLEANYLGTIISQENVRLLTSTPIQILFVIPDLTGEWASLAQGCKETKKGVKCKISGNLNIQNIGTEKSRSSFVRFYLSDDNTYDAGDTFLKQTSTGKIKAGANKAKKLSYCFPVDISASGKYVIAVIDADNTVNEGLKIPWFVVTNISERWLRLNLWLT